MSEKEFTNLLPVDVLIKSEEQGSPIGGKYMDREDYVRLAEIRLDRAFASELKNAKDKVDRLKEALSEIPKPDLETVVLEHYKEPLAEYKRAINGVARNCIKVVHAINKIKGFVKEDPFITWPEQASVIINEDGDKISGTLSWKPVCDSIDMPKLVTDFKFKTPAKTKREIEKYNKLLDKLSLAERDLSKLEDRIEDAKLRIIPEIEECVIEEIAAQDPNVENLNDRIFSKFNSFIKKQKLLK